MSEAKLTKMRKPPVPAPLKNKVWLNQHGEAPSGKCYCCRKVIRQASFSTGHIIAHDKGGPMTEENLRAICKSCNSSMGTQNMDEYRIKYFPKPIARDMDDLRIDFCRITTQFQDLVVDIDKIKALEARNTDLQARLDEQLAKELANELAKKKSEDETMEILVKLNQRVQKSITDNKTIKFLESKIATLESHIAKTNCLDNVKLAEKIQELEKQNLELKAVIDTNKINSGNTINLVKEVENTVRKNIKVYTDEMTKLLENYGNELDIYRNMCGIIPIPSVIVKHILSNDQLHAQFNKIKNSGKKVYIKLGEKGSLTLLEYNEK